MWTFSLLVLVRQLKFRFALLLLVAWWLHHHCTSWYSCIWAACSSLDFHDLPLHLLNLALLVDEFELSLGQEVGHFGLVGFAESSNDVIDVLRAAL